MGAPGAPLGAVKSSPISDPLSWLIGSSVGCLCGWSLDRLVSAALGGCRGGFVIETCEGLRFYVPCMFWDWVWANIVHVACLDDYGVLVGGLRGIVVDAGGGFGVFAAAAVQAGAERVYVVEPSPRARRLIEEMLEVLGFEDRVVVLPYALGPYTGRGVLYESDNVVNSSLLQHYPASRGAGIAERLEVDVVTFSRLLSLLSLSRVSLLKLDIEGLEEAVVEEMASSGALARLECLAVEAHQAGSWRRIRTLLEAAGMKIVYDRADMGFQQFFLKACWPRAGER